MKKAIYTIMMLMFTAMGTSAQTQDKVVVITSDWHLSDARSFDPDCYYARTDKNQGRLLAFLQRLKDTSGQWDVLVLNGDIFEFWRKPSNMYMTADAQGNIVDDVQYLGLIKEQNAEIFSTLEDMHNMGKELVYMPGNHDLTVSKEDLDGAFPGLFTSYYDTDATGIYEPFGEGTPVVIEHGNRYEYYDAPYQHGVFGSEGTSSTSLLAPGFFVVSLDAYKAAYNTGVAKAKAAFESEENKATATEENDADNRTYLSTVWNAIRAAEGVNVSCEVKTNVDGIGTDGNDVFGWSDYATSETNNPKLFKESWKIENWKKRQELNNVPVYVPLVPAILGTEFHDYLDDMAYTERLNNTSLPTLICVFGHSHTKMLTTRHDSTKGDVIYLNEGGWVDNASACNYGVVKYTSAKHLYTVELHQFEENGTDAITNCKYLIVPENNATKLSDGTWQFNAKATIVDPEITGVNEVNNETGKSSQNIYYSLSGQRLSAPVKGINICNGKKFIQK